MTVSSRVPGREESPHAIQAQKHRRTSHSSAKTVGELRKLTAWPENLTIATPLDPHPGSIVSVAKRA